jgi:uncharacterized membrane protein
MDDLILAGALSIIGFFAAVVILVTAVVFTLTEMSRAMATNDPGRATFILAIVLLVLITYTGAGLWLQKSGRI